MNSDTTLASLPGAATAAAPSLHAVPAAARTALALLRRLQVGTLHLEGPGGFSQVCGRGEAPHATLRLHDWRTCAWTLQRGDVGFGEAYLEGGWSTPDLPALLRLLIANREVLEQAVYGTWWGALWRRVRHALHRNTRAGSRRNIAAHYDLGNAFYRLWLDDTLNYSSAWFDGRTDQSLPAAQRAKMRRALAECGLQPGQRVLEVGCGWGAVAEQAARDGLQLTGVTLSTEQLAHAQARLAAQGLRADLRLQDYRDIPERDFDGIVSIEMFEAVGREYWAGYFRSLHERLKPGGRACIQTITIRDDLFERYLRGTDFIQQYVFPGGLLPSPSAFRAAAEAAGFQVVNELHFGGDYAETLRRWRRSFLAREGSVREQGFDERFVRLWDFYLAYCEAAFDTGNTGVVQFTLQRA
ncbi:class I SAM-dependent methyltransferase [Ideonella sp.]|uniref:class I SAM-dependent methyltransferase n=1 Tax=Ideonella sp. TaxID=1929293 RepID=UPI0035B099BC